MKSINNIHIEMPVTHCRYAVHAILLNHAQLKANPNEYQKIKDGINKLQNDYPQSSNILNTISLGKYIELLDEYLDPNVKVTL